MQVSYGKRARVGEFDRGVRTVAPTYGRGRILTFSQKSSGTMVVDGNAERVAVQMMTIDPSVRSFSPQPFTVDLKERRLLTTKEQLSAARKKHGGRSGHCFYTPDFALAWSMGTKTALEVKSEEWPGDDEYEERLQLAEPILTFYGYELRKLVVPAHASHPLKRNLALLQRATGREIKHLLTAERIDRLDGKARMTLGAACDALGVETELAPVLFMAGVISMDLAGSPMRGDTQVEAAFGGLDHLCLVGSQMQ